MLETEPETEAGDSNSDKHRHRHRLRHRHRQHSDRHGRIGACSFNKPKASFGLATISECPILQPFSNDNHKSDNFALVLSAFCYATIAGLFAPLKAYAEVSRAFLASTVPSHQRRGSGGKKHRLREARLDPPPEIGDPQHCRC